MGKYQEVRQCTECKKIYKLAPYICHKCGARLIEDKTLLFQTNAYRTDNLKVVIAKRTLFGWKVKESEG